MNQQRLRSLAIYAAVNICLLSRTAAFATGPSSDDPEAVFPCGPLPGNQEEYATAVDAYQRAAELIRQVIQVHEESGFKKAMLLEIGKAATAVSRAERWGKRLELVGEPASFLVLEPMREARIRLVELRSKILADDKVAKLVASTREKWLNEAAKQEKKSIPKAKQLAEQKQWDEAAQALYESMDKLTPQGFWYDSTTQETGFGPFQRILPPIESELFTMIRDRAVDERKQAIGRETPDFAAIEREIGTAIEGVAQAGKGSLDGIEHTGPELIAAIGARWRQAQLATWRARAHHWGLKQLTGIGGIPPELSAIEKEYERFAGAMIQAYARLIDADTARVATNDVASLHHEYVEALVPLLEFDHGRLLTSGAEQSLGKLAAKSPEFAADLAAYARATSDLLRWLQRAALAKAQRYQADFQASRVVYEEVLRCNSKGESTRLASFACVRHVPDLIADANPKVVGRQAMFGNVSMLAAGGAVAIYDDRHYARLAPGVDLSTTVAELKSCLFAQQASPPLTLEAYSAIATAEHGFCEQVGGQIEGFELEALLTRFAILDESDWGLATLGTFFNEGIELPLRQLLVAFTVTPVWARHRYGLVRIKGG